MGNFISDDLIKNVNKKIQTIDVFKKVLSEKEILEKMPEVNKFYGNSDNLGKVYFDGMRSWLFIRTPEKETNEEGKATNLPTKVESKFETAEQSYYWRCVSPLGLITLFITSDQFKQMKGWDKLVLVTGRLTTKYALPDSSSITFKNLNEVAVALNVPSLEKLDKNSYRILYSLGVWQIIGVY